MVYATKDGGVTYQGLDSTDTQSPYVPNATNIDDLKWLGDGTILYIVQGKDNKFNFSVQAPGGTAKFMGLLNTDYSYAAIQLTTTPDKATPIASCVESATTTPEATALATDNAIPTVDAPDNSGTPDATATP